jgi:hypothetical protein
VRRALVLLSVVTAGLLGACASPAGSAGAAVPRSAAKPSYTIENLYINRRVGNFLVSVAGGTDQAATTITISRGRESASYYTKDWHLEGKELSVHFGDLGYLHMTFHGAPDLGVRCGDRTDIDGKFKGDFRFRGEGGYISFDLHSVPGHLGEVRDPCPSGARRLRLAGKGGTKETGATLEAHTPGRPPSDVLFVFGSHESPAKRAGEVFLVQAERRGELVIARETVSVVGRTGFRWDFTKGSATVRPAAPFSGRLVYHGDPGGRGRMTGTLRAPMLGGAPALIDGKNLAAHLKRGLPADE